MIDLEPGLLFLIAVAVTLAVVLLVTAPSKLGEALATAKRFGGNLILRVPLVFFAASFLARLIPPDTVSAALSAESGVRGVLIATVVGGVMPGGAAVAFPLALVLWQLGTGPAQMTALLTSWSVFAMHRVLIYELPMLGPRFVALRLSSSWIIPLVAGGVALLIF